MVGKKSQRFNMRIEGDFEDRLEKLMKKKGLDRSGIVRLAIAEMYERELVYDPKKKGNP